MAKRNMSSSGSLYRMFMRVRGSAPATPVVIGMVVAVAAITAVSVVRVSRQHEVLRVGYQLTERSERVNKLRETKRQLQLERASLTSPDRIRRLANSLGMTPVAPDRIRIIDPRRDPTVAQLP